MLVLCVQRLIALAHIWELYKNILIIYIYCRIRPKFKRFSKTNDFSQCSVSQNISRLIAFAHLGALKIKNTAKLYGDALVWTVVFIDCLDLFELIYYTFELIGLTLFNWLIEWMDESNISFVQNLISHTWFKLVWLNISRLKVLLDNWF